jgi:hypothetical protein
MDNVQAASDEQNRGWSRFPGIGFHEVKNRMFYGRSKRKKIWKAVLKLGSGKVGAEK